MSEDQFRIWLSDLRELVVDLWDNKGQPPKVGYNQEEIIKQFNKMEGFPVQKFLIEDECTNEKNVIRNTSFVGNAVNQWFPTMMKTKISYTSVDKARSIYDYFADPNLFETQLTYSRRHFKRDSFYHYSNPVRKCDPENFLISAESGAEWIKKFEELNLRNRGYDYWLEPRDTSDDKYTGYNEALRSVEWIEISKCEINDLGVVPEKCLTNIDYGNFENCRIRLYEYNQKIFPHGFKAFRLSYAQQAVNFPPLTAKLIYEKYTQEFLGEDIINIWDPSAGWGGRLLGALSCDTAYGKRKIHYIGTDPNKDHTLNDGSGLTKYDNFANFYNSKTNRAYGLFTHKNTWEIHQCGSEVFKNTEAFEKYKNNVSLVFTSPPYFAKEVYSDDAEQSCHKFTEYESWRDDFLKPTIETAFELLKPGGYLIWNIADAKFGKETLPLEEDSCNIMKSLGMVHVETLKMSLAQMPGGNRVDSDTGRPTSKNFCKVNGGMWLKYEPIFVFRK
jgi:hypothetical protein